MVFLAVLGEVVTGMVKCQEHKTLKSCVLNSSHDRWCLRVEMQIKRYLKNSCLWIRHSVPASQLCYAGVSWYDTQLKSIELCRHRSGVYGGGESVPHILRRTASCWGKSACHKTLMILNQVPTEVPVQPLLFPLTLMLNESAQDATAEAWPVPICRHYLCPAYA